ncbi:MAG: hypothetical protein V1792_09780 [Pseudomonadota bacterium]
MRNFDFYEFACMLGPGAIVLACFAVLYPGFSEVLLSKNLGAGNLGVFLILAYMAGSLVQAGGNLLEWLWWGSWGGMPTDWVRTGRRKPLSEAQIKALEDRIPSRLTIDGAVTIAELSRAEWYNVTRQIHTEVARQGVGQRLEVLTASYGLNRGLTSALLIACAMVSVKYAPLSRWSLLLLLLGLIALYRMHRFGIHYARELFLEFLQLPAKEKAEEDR